MQKIICVLGATGVGKSALAITLAKKFDGEIVSADSMQVYKGMDIGTAKVTESEMQGIPHYMLNVADLNEKFTTADWLIGAKKAIDEITQKGKVPIVVGGTGLYFNSLLYDYNFAGEQTSESDRAKYERILAEKGENYLWDILNGLDKNVANLVPKTKHKAIIRAICVLKSGGEFQVLDKDKNFVYDALIIGLTSPREELYKRVNERVDKMLEGGLEEEFDALVTAGLKENTQQGLAIGYREFFDYKRGKYGKARLVELIKQHSRNYVKRQYTWFNHLKGVEWFSSTEMEKIEQICKEHLCKK